MCAKRARRVSQECPKSVRTSGLNVECERKVIEVGPIACEEMRAFCISGM